MINKTFYFLLFIKYTVLEVCMSNILKKRGEENIKIKCITFISHKVTKEIKTIKTRLILINRMLCIF